MNYQQLKSYLQGKPAAVEEYPFYPDTPVFKVRGKIFAILFEQDGMTSVNLKCEPDQANALRDIFPAVKPGYHMNKRHWNTVLLDGSIPSAEIERMVDHSYALIVKGLKKIERQALETLHGEQALYKGL